MKAEIRKRIAQGWTQKQILDEMVASFGPGVLSTPATHGFDLLAWALPIGGIGAGALALGGGAWYWTRQGRRDPRPGDDDESDAMDSDLERLVDDELARFDP
jgi:cytochrome c-type biogenesis protein CcmH/NrfF